MVLSSEAIALARNFALQRGIRLDLRGYDEFTPGEDRAKWSASDWREDIRQFSPSGGLLLVGVHYRRDGTAAGVVTYTVPGHVPPY